MWVQTHTCLTPKSRSLGPWGGTLTREASRVCTVRSRVAGGRNGRSGDVARVCIPVATGPVIWEEHAFAPEEDFVTQSPEVWSPTEPRVSEVDLCANCVYGPPPSVPAETPGADRP